MARPFSQRYTTAVIPIPSESNHLPTLPQCQSAPSSLFRHSINSSSSVLLHHTINSSSSVLLRHSINSLSSVLIRHSINSSLSTTSTSSEYLELPFRQRIKAVPQLSTSAECLEVHSVKESIKSSTFLQFQSIWRSFSVTVSNYYRHSRIFGSSLTTSIYTSSTYLAILFRYTFVLTKSNCTSSEYLAVPFGDSVKSPQTSQLAECQITTTTFTFSEYFGVLFRQRIKSPPTL